MKILKRILIAILVIAIILGLSLLGLRCLLIKIFNTPYIGKEAEIELFNKNFSVYENVAQTLSSNTGETDVEVTHGIIEKDDAYMDDGFIYYELDKKIMLRVFSEKTKISNGEIKKINQSDTWKIFKDLDYEMVEYGEGWVYFINRAYIGGTIGILYYIGEMTNDDPRCYMEKIADNWYYCLCE